MDALNLQDMVYAYRKAKVDAYYERTVSSAASFALYEENLEGNLRSLLNDLGKPAWFKNFDNWLGEPVVYPKALKTKGPDDAQNEFVIGLDDCVADELRKKSVAAEFRLVSNPSVHAFVVSSLWINKVGVKLDAHLRGSVRGSRLRRRQAQHGAVDAPLRDPKGAYSLNALGSFEPYFRPYDKWRKDGLSAIRTAMANGQQVAAITMDIANYYHDLDVDFLVSSQFLDDFGVEFDIEEFKLHKQFVNGLKQWQVRCQKMLARLGAGSTASGIPIGLPASRIVANVALAALDEKIEDGVAPLYYGRYVDDLFVVFTSNAKHPREAIEFLASNSGGILRLEEGGLRLHHKAGLNSQPKLRFQSSKQKIFLLKGPPAIDLIDNIEAQIRNVSSERRLMTAADDLEELMSARVLTSSMAEPAETLRHADTLSVRRLSWSIQLRNAERLAADLPGVDWKNQRAKFIEFAKNHILRADRIFDYIAALPRLLALALDAEEFDFGQALFQAYAVASRTLRGLSCNVKINGLAAANPAMVWDNSISAIANLQCEAAIKGRNVARYPEKLKKQIEALYGTSLEPLAQKILWADLARTRYVDQPDLRTRQPNERIARRYDHYGEIKDALGGKYKHSIFPFVFSVRPYTSSEILNRFAPKALSDSAERMRWGRMVRAFRGSFVETSIEKSGGTTAPDGYVVLKRHGPTYFAIPSLSVPNEYFEAGAVGVPNLTAARYKTICEIVNQCLNLRPKPTHFLMPELSLPQRWLTTVSRTLAHAGISLIAGLDYVEEKGQVSNQVALSLLDQSLGYAQFINLRQVKARPALHEEAELRRLTPRPFLQRTGNAPIYEHGDLSFALFICSEFTDVEARARLRGNVDAVVILSWNSDIESFDNLINASALDLHAHIAIANNRLYGNSKMRTPAKEGHQRDLVVLRGGLNDHVAVVEVETKKLREFHSQAARTSNPYKPVPDGFQVNGRRRSPNARK